MPDVGGWVCADGKLQETAQVLCVANSQALVRRESQAISLCSRVSANSVNVTPGRESDASACFQMCNLKILGRIHDSTEGKLPF